jgi:lipopolysaccharide/colanic/teichoic acid biosynthesis glycosyltransferase
MLISIWLRFEIFPLEAYTVVLIVYSVVWISSLSVSGCYRKNNTFSFIKPVNGILAGFFINSAFTYFFNQFAFSRVVVLRSTAYAIIALLFWRFLFKLIRYSKQRYPAYSENNTLIIGKDDEAERFLNKLRVRPDQEYNIIGFINPEPKTDSSYIGNLNNIGDVIKVYRIKTVVFVKRVLSNQRILDTMWALRNSNLRYMILSEDSELILGKSAVDKIENVYLMQIEYNINRKINIFVKRIFDISVSGVFLILIYPFIFLYSGFSKNKNNGIFVQKILQLPVVLSGRISLIGRAEWDTSAAGKQYLGKKGLTGLVQINFYKNLEADDIEYYNFYYAKNQSLSLDIEILLKTFSLIFFRRRFVKL